MQSYLSIRLFRSTRYYKTPEKICDTIVRRADPSSRNLFRCDYAYSDRTRGSSSVEDQPALRSKMVERKYTETKTQQVIFVEITTTTASKFQFNKSTLHRLPCFAKQREWRNNYGSFNCQRFFTCSPMRSQPFLLRFPLDSSRESSISATHSLPQKNLQSARFQEDCLRCSLRRF